MRILSKGWASLNALVSSGAAIADPVTEAEPTKRLRKPRAVKGVAASPKAPKPKADSALKDAAKSAEIAFNNAVAASFEQAKAEALKEKNGSVLLNKAVTASGVAEATARVFGAWMNHTFDKRVQAIRQFKGLHWYDLSEENVVCNQAKVIFNEINTLKAECKALATAKRLVNLNKPWSDIRIGAKSLIDGVASGGKGTRAPKKSQTLDAFLMDSIQKAYIKGYKAVGPTETAAQATFDLGEILRDTYGIDIEALTKDLG